MTLPGGWIALAAVLALAVLSAVTRSECTVTLGSRLRAPT
jgi:hypothetical protein